MIKLELMKSHGILVQKENAYSPVVSTILLHYNHLKLLFIYLVLFLNRY